MSVQYTERLFRVLKDAGHVNLSTKYMARDPALYLHHSIAWWSILPGAGVASRIPYYTLAADLSLSYAIHCCRVAISYGRVPTQATLFEILYTTITTTTTTITTYDVKRRRIRSPRAFCLHSYTPAHP